MEQVTGRPRVAKAYAWLISLAALVVVVQGSCLLPSIPRLKKASLMPTQQWRIFLFWLWL